jgi:nucleoside-diphosphate-sugar epimerase
MSLDKRATGPMTAKALITGGNGYVGNALVRKLLSRGVEVHTIVNRNADRLSGLLPRTSIHPIANDLGAIAGLVGSLNPNTIYHLAAVYGEPLNLDGMTQMLNCDISLGTTLLHGASLCDLPPAFINIGTYWQFGEANNSFSPNTFYAATKRAMHDILLYFRSLKGIRAVTLVLYDIFGPDDPRPKLWTKLAQAAAGSVLPVTQGRQSIELVHVDDVIKAIEVAADGLAHGTLVEPAFAVGANQRVTLRRLLEDLRDRAGLNIQFDWGAVQYSPSQIFDPWTGPRLPGWEPVIAPVEGLAKLLIKMAISK